MPDALISHSTPRSQSYSIIMLLFATICCPHYLCSHFALSHSLSPSLYLFAVRGHRRGDLNRIESQEYWICTQRSRDLHQNRTDSRRIPQNVWTTLWGWWFSREQGKFWRFPRLIDKVLSNFAAAQHIIFYSMNTQQNSPGLYRGRLVFFRVLYPLKLR